MADIRIKDLPETLDVGADDYVAVDNAGDGTRKFTLRQLVSSVGAPEFVVNVNNSGEADKTLAEIMTAIANGYVPVVAYDDSYYQLTKITETAITFTKYDELGEMSSIGIMDGAIRIEDTSLTSDDITNASEVNGSTVTSALEELGYGVTTLTSNVGDVQNSVDELNDSVSGLDSRVTVLESEGGSGGSGLTYEEKNLILELFSKAAYSANDANTAFTALSSLWGGYSIRWIGSGYTKGNNAISVDAGDTFSSTISANVGFDISDVAVTMGGETMTGVWSNGVVTIPNVTGNIVITVSTTQRTAVSINAVYTQSGSVYDTDALDVLKPDLLVTATFSDGSSGEISQNDYTLTGALTYGTSIITVNYAGLTDEIQVSVETRPITQISWAGGGKSGEHTITNDDGTLTLGWIRKDTVGEDYYQAWAGDVTQGQTVHLEFNNENMVSCGMFLYIVDSNDVIITDNTYTGATNAQISGNLDSYLVWGHSSSKLQTRIGGESTFTVPSTGTLVILVRGNAYIPNDSVSSGSNPTLRAAVINGVFNFYAV